MEFNSGFKGLIFNNCMLCPHCIYVCCIYLRTNSDLCHLQHKLIGFYNRDEKCLLRGTVWAFNFWHRRFTFNSNKSPTWCKSFLVYYPGVCLQLNMFRAFSLPSSGAQWLQWQPLVLPSYRGDSRTVFETLSCEKARNMLSCKQTSV